MKLLLLTFLAALALAQSDPFTTALDEAARIATIFVDGDLCERIVTPRARDYMFRNDPKDKWAAGDNYDVNHEAFNHTKKTLIRVAKLVPFPADANLWMPIKGQPDKIRVVIRNANELSQFWPWGALYQDMIPEMRTVLETGRRLSVTTKPGWVSVLAPVANSLGDTVGIVEVASRRSLDPHDNVK
jgi:hypothetical protein